MIRWWSNPETSELVLKSVDDSDVVNGVGTALLGYHGLSMRVLGPLATQTLVDTYTVRKALEKVDLGPIAKALSEATKPIMGNASVKYGEMLADDFHKRATDATERLLLTWTNNGMAWPNAIERATEVHGVPIERLGRYANVMKSVGINPSIRADYADRALMEYASSVGTRESMISSELIDKQMAFDESEHPRDDEGKFTEKTSAESKSSQSLKDLRALRNRRKSTLKVTELPKAVQPASTNLFDLINTKSAVVAEPAKQTVFNQFAKPKLAKFKKFVISDPGDDFDNPLPPNSSQYSFGWDNTNYIPIQRGALDKIIAGGRHFYAGRLNAETFSKEETWLAVRDLEFTESKKDYDAQTVLLRSTYTPIDENSMDALTSGTGALRDSINNARVLDNARFKIVGDLYSEDIGTKTVALPWNVINIELENFDEINKSVSKNSDKVNDAAFNAEHPRNNLGRFVDKPSKKNDLAQLRDIRALRKKRNIVVADDVKAKTSESATIFDLINSKDKATAFALQPSGAKFTNFAPVKTAKFTKYARKEDGKLPFNDLVGIFVPSDLINVDLQNPYDLENLLLDKEFLPLTSSSNYGFDTNLLFEALIRDADYRRPESIKPDTFSYATGAGYAQAPITFPSPLLALDFANKQLEENLWSPATAYDHLAWQAEAKELSDGNYAAQMVPYESKPYQILLGSPEDMSKIDMDNISFTELPIETFKELLASRDKESDTMDLGSIGHADKYTNPNVQVFMINKV